MIKTLFNRIAHRYDLLNRLLSFGQDMAWRRKTAAFLPTRPDMKVLDLATGTADLALVMVENAQVIQVTGVDIAEDMLKIGRQKVARLGFSHRIELQTGDAHDLHLQDASFDAVTVAFGLRNMPDRKQALSEMMRVLKPGGRLIVLEFSIPNNRIFKALYLFYFRHILPWVGGLISGDFEAYRYLNRSVEAFSAQELAQFSMHPISLGIVTIYVADKLA